MENNNANTSIERIMNTESLFDTNEKENGLINELIRLMSEGKIVKVKGNKKKKTKEKESWVLDIIHNDEFVLGSFAKYVYNQVYKSFAGIDDRNDKENLVGNTLLLVSDSLSELVIDKKYQTIFNNLGLKQNIDGMKAILINEDYSKQLYGYLKKIVEIKIKNLIRDGYSYNIDGKEFHKNGNYQFTDYVRESSINTKDNDGNQLYPDGFFESIMDENAHKYTEYEEKNYHSVLELVMDNKENIFTDKQLEFLKNWQDKNKYTRQNAYDYRKNIAKRLFEFCDNHPYIMKDKNGKYSIRKTTLDDIVSEADKQKTNKDKFIYLMNKLMENQTMLDRFIDKIIDNYDNNYYRPLVKYINKKEIDLVFINNEFTEILDFLR